MAPKFGNIKFNLMRAIEIFQDMNHEDMDVMAPPSGYDFAKEREVAERLNGLLMDLIDEGLFEECDLRDVPSSTDDESEDDDSDYDLSAPESEGFSNADSQESLTGRFKRYVRRILPGSRRSSDSQHNDRSGGQSESGRSSSFSQSISGSGRASQSRSRRSNEGSGSSSSSQEVEGSLSNDPDVVYEHSHRHKHRHRGPHHHHSHSGPHNHTYHSHSNEQAPSFNPNEEGPAFYSADSDDDLSSGPLTPSRTSSRSSTRSRPNSQSSRRRTLSRKRSSTRSSGSR